MLVNDAYQVVPFAEQFSTTVDFAEVSGKVSTTKYISLVQHDLMTLLNYKRTFNHSANQLLHLQDSLFYYGLPDISHYNPLSEVDRCQVKSLLQDAITKFEKRLDHVRVSETSDVTENINTHMYFQISANLLIPHQAEMVAVLFDSSIQMATETVVISPEVGVYHGR